MGRVSGAEVTRFVYISFSVLNFLSLVIKFSSTFLVQGRYLSHGRFISCFGGRGSKSQSVFLAPAVF